MPALLEEPSPRPTAAGCCWLRWRVRRKRWGITYPGRQPALRSICCPLPPDTYRRARGRVDALPSARRRGAARPDRSISGWLTLACRSIPPPCIVSPTAISDRSTFWQYRTKTMPGGRGVGRCNANWPGSSARTTTPGCREHRTVHGARAWVRCRVALASAGQG